MLHAQQQVVVGTRLADLTLLQPNTSTSIDLAAFFQAYPAPGPVATFNFTAPVPAGKRDLKVGLQTDPNTGQTLTDADGNPILDLSDDSPTVSMPTFETVSGEPYAHAFQVTTESLRWNAHSIDFQLLPLEAPVTVANFMTYIADGAYTNSLIHRNDYTGEVFRRPGGLALFDGLAVIQAGGWQVEPSGDALFKRTPTRGPIALELAAENTEGTLSMARTSVADSATSQFFVNLDNNTPSLGNFYAVFGRLIDMEAGLATFRDFAQTPVFDLTYIFTGGTFTTIPAYTADFFNPDSFLRFDSISVSEGTIENLAFAWEFADNDDEVSDAEAANRAAFDISIDPATGHLNIQRGTQTGRVTVNVTASLPGSEDITLPFGIIGYNEDALNMFPGAFPSTDRWLFTTFYGWFIADDFPFLYHPNHGTQYIDPTSTSPDFYIFDQSIGSWLLISSLYYPNIFVFNTNEWVYYFLDSGANGANREFYRYADGATVDESAF